MIPLWLNCPPKQNAGLSLLVHPNQQREQKYFVQFKTHQFKTYFNPKSKKTNKKTKQKNLLRATCANQVEPTKENLANESAQMPNLN